MSATVLYTNLEHELLEDRLQLDRPHKLLAGEGGGQQGEGHEVDGVPVNAVPLAHQVTYFKKLCDFSHHLIINSSKSIHTQTQIICFSKLTSYEDEHFIVLSGAGYFTNRRFCAFTG
jgi:hypothetical protein